MSDSVFTHSSRIMIGNGEYVSRLVAIVCDFLQHQWNVAFEYTHPSDADGPHGSARSRRAENLLLSRRRISSRGQRCVRPLVTAGDCAHGEIIQVTRRLKDVSAVALVTRCSCCKGLATAQFDALVEPDLWHTVGTNRIVVVCHLHLVFCCVELMHEVQEVHCSCSTQECSMSEPRKRSVNVARRVPRCVQSSKCA
jgi:hypothetical protein